MKTRPATASLSSTQEPDLPTFMDHLQELKGRFFWVAVYFVVASGLAYPRFQDIVHFLTAPLGNQKLYYMTPAGGLSFILKVCMYVGIIAILPVVIYHLYKFVTPVMKKDNARAVAGYTITSTLLALAGIAFAYYLTLPAALHFLTSINLDQISSMLTIDSYMSFVVAYVLAGALLFQTPIVMLIINSITPIKPGKMMNYQRHMVVVSFVLAAIISPTPDVVNQAILAAPMIVMYQIGIVAVWIRNRKRTPRHAQHATTRQHGSGLAAQPAAAAPRESALEMPSFVTSSAPMPRTPERVRVAAPVAAKPVQLQQKPSIVVRTHRSMDGVRVGSPTLVRPQQGIPSRTSLSTVARAAVAARPNPSTRQRTVDGFMIPSI